MTMIKKTLKVPKNIAIVTYVSILIGTIIMAVLLCMQYRFFMQEAQELIQVKESYSQHVEMLKRSLYASLSGDSSESNDEPDDLDSKKKNESIISDLPADVFIASIDEEKIVEPRFDLITPEEDSRLHSLKKTAPKVKSRTRLSKKKSFKRRAVTTAAYNRGGNYEPLYDFDFAWPIELSKFWLSSLYGHRRFSNGKVSFHHGIDMASVRGTVVKASAAGKVVCAQYVSGYGNCVDIYHDKHYKTRYAHLYSISVHVGQMVQAGQRIGTVGDTGHVRKSGKDGSHLHFEIHQDGQSINPLKFLFT